MMDARDEAAKEQRLLILRVLMEEPARHMNDRMIRRALVVCYAHSMGEDRLRILLAWLRDAGCVEIEDLEEVWGITLTALGAEVVRAETILPGIAHPMDVR